MSAMTTPNLSTVDLPQGTITYRVVGPATSEHPPVVFVHGMLVDSLLWTGVADALAERGIRSYLPNWPLGSHRVPMHADADLSPRGVARIVIDFLEAFDLTDVTLVGNDTGGAVCQFLIDTDHSRIGRLVLTNCDAFNNFPPEPFDTLFKLGRSKAVLKVMMASMRPTFLRHSALGFGLLLNDKPDPAVTRSWIEPCASDKLIRRDTVKTMKSVKPAELLDVASRLGEFDKPVQLVWGDADRLFKLKFAERLAAAFPDATLTRIPGGRSFVPLEEPEQVGAAIAAMVVTRT